MAVTPRGADARAAFALAARPGRTFRGDWQKGALDGMTDGREAVRQAVFLILHTERYGWPIHSWGYGVELHSLIGKDPAYCVPEIERRVKEALLQDDRITAVRDFSFTVQKKKVLAAFAVESIYGSIESGLEVAI